MERSSSLRVPRAFSAVQWLGLLAFGAALAGLHASIDLRRYQDSDLYYLPALYADLVSWGGRLSEWKLPPAPYFFPDMALYFPVQAVLRNYPLAFVVAGALQAVLWLAGW